MKMASRKPSDELRYPEAEPHSNPQFEMDAREEHPRAPQLERQTLPDNLA